MTTAAADIFNAYYIVFQLIFSCWQNTKNDLDDELQTYSQTTTAHKHYTTS